MYHLRLVEFGSILLDFSTIRLCCFALLSFVCIRHLVPERRTQVNCSSASVFPYTGLLYIHLPSILVHFSLDLPMHTLPIMDFLGTFTLI